MAGYPIVLGIGNRLCVVVGGGAVSLRKVQGMLAAGATNVRVVSPVLHPEMPAQIERVEDVYRPEHISGALLVFAATDQPAVNDAVVRDAARNGSLVCRADADDELAGDFSTPAMIREEPLLVTVSSGGSPALSALIRDRIAKVIDPRWAQMAEAMQSLRPVIRQRIAANRRPEVFRSLCTDAAMDALAYDGIEGLCAWLGERFPELNG